MTLRFELEVLGGLATVLVRDRAPSPDRDRSLWCRPGAVLLSDVDLVGEDAAAVLPSVAEVERETELVPRRHLLRDIERRMVFRGWADREVVVREADPAAAVQLELVQVGDPTGRTID
jgi:hypothetical protein